MDTKKISMSKTQVHGSTLKIYSKITFIQNHVDLCNNIFLGAIRYVKGKGHTGTSSEKRI